MTRAKYSEFIGVAIYIGLTLLLCAGISSPECHDGWNSPSIGSQGACSHHGGVNHHAGKYFLSVAIGAAAGFLVYFICAAVERRINTIQAPPIDPNILGPAEVISHAIQNNQRIEFIYSKPGERATTRSMLPIKLAYAPRDGHRAILCATGFCQIRQSERTFAVSRMSSVRLVPGPNNSFKPNPLRGSA